MILQSHLKHLTALPKSLTFSLKRSYVKQSDIDQISKKYDSHNSKIQKMKMYTAIFGHIVLEGFAGFKKDITLFKELDAKPKHTLDEIKTLMRIHHDVLKMGPLVIIQILPFSGPLFMLYMYTYPGSIPSWFMIDFYHDRHEELKVQNQLRALQHFQQLGFKSEDIKIDEMSLRDLRKLCLLLFGIYRDGTVGYRKLFNTKIPYLFAEGYSRFLIKRYMTKMFKRDLVLKSEIEKFESLEDMARWKFQKIMKGELRFEYKPMYEKTLQKMEKNGGQEAEIFNEIKKDSLEAPASDKKTEENPNQNQQKK